MTIFSRAAACTLGLMAVTSASQAATYTTFKANVNALGTNLATINNDGVVAGVYYGLDLQFHAYRRDTDGSIDLYSSLNGQGTNFIFAINRARVAVGTLGNQALVLRPDGTFDTFGSGGGFNSSARLSDINDKGEAAGNFTNDSGVAFGFTRTKKGKIHNVKIRGAAQSWAYGINNLGSICGQFIDSSGKSHGFLRIGTDKPVTFDVAGAASVQPKDINANGVVAGTYTDANRAAHGFVRATDGTIATFDATGAGTAANQGTSVWGINKQGIVVGTVVDSGNVSHGFRRLANGTIGTFDVPGSDLSAFHGTVAEGINDGGQISGVYTPVSDQNAAFIRNP